MFIYDFFITNIILNLKKLFIYWNSFLRQRQFYAPSLHIGYQLSYGTDGVNPPWRAGGWSCTFPARACNICSQLLLTLLNLGWQEGHLAVCPWHEYLVSIISQITQTPRVSRCAVRFRHGIWFFWAFPMGICVCGRGKLDLSLLGTYIIDPEQGGFMWYMGGCEAKERRFLLLCFLLSHGCWSSKNIALGL